MIEQIISLEWDMFQNVKNNGGRANCQDDFQTFYIMRKSQYLCFKDNVLESYLIDLQNALAQGRNLIFEKYAYMMEYTHKDEFDKISQYLPKASKRTQQIIEEIIQIELTMREELSHHCPKLIQLSRMTYTLDDSFDHTSFETYLRGELLTYSNHTLSLYASMIIEYCKNNINIIKNIMENTVKAYGYQDLEDAENKQ